MKFTKPDLWRPQGIPELEPAAWEALRHEGCVCVVAGPGAGKTEFLAQRAMYLLQTGICRPPFRILAISFKKDAAENLRARVQKRSQPGQANRFDSMNFDQFTKSLVDRFLTAIPPSWQPTAQYDIALPNTRDVEQFLTSIRSLAQKTWQTGIVGIQPSFFEPRHVGTHRLALEPVAPATAAEFAIQQWWEEYLRKQPRSGLTFTMINRLAELLLRANPQILRALQLTYPFIFIDEFQDTTYAQYDFLLSVFGESGAVITSVGDNKQRIMGWAGALPDAFNQFETDFQAREIPLLFNFRSSPGLVSIQHVVARAIDAKAAPTQTHVQQAVDGEVAKIWSFQTETTEATQIATWLLDDMRQRGKHPRDYVLLVKQKADRFSVPLEQALAAVGLHLRNESRQIGKMLLQDLLVEELVRIGIAILRVASQSRAPEAWGVASEAISTIRNIDLDDELGCYKAEKELRTFTEELREFMDLTPPTPEVAVEVTDRLLNFLDLSNLARSFAQYGTGESLINAVESLRLHLSHSAEGATTWKECLDNFEGKDCIPLMTVHKSKGLEYDTIIFVGLDDKTWWSYTAGDLEGLATFFVALSRAKQRAIFTFCTVRGPRTRIDDLYKLLKSAGVTENTYP